MPAIHLCAKPRNSANLNHDSTGYFKITAIINEIIIAVTLMVNFVIKLHFVSYNSGTADNQPNLEKVSDLENTFDI